MSSNPCLDDTGEGEHKRSKWKAFTSVGRVKTNLKLCWGRQESGRFRTSTVLTHGSNTAGSLQTQRETGVDTGEKCVRCMYVWRLQKSSLLFVTSDKHPAVKFHKCSINTGFGSSSDEIWDLCFKSACRYSFKTNASASSVFTEDVQKNKFWRNWKNHSCCACTDTDSSCLWLHY